jgi:hypothetical protein
MGTTHSETPDEVSAIPEHLTYFNWRLLGSRQNDSVKNLLLSFTRGSTKYPSASKRILSVLDPIHNSAIRLCTGAFRTSRVERIRGTCTCHLPTNCTLQLCHKAEHSQESQSRSQSCFVCDEWLDRLCIYFKCKYF